MAKEAGESLKGKRLVLVVTKPPTFMAQTPGKAAFALLGTAMMASAGQEVVAKNKVEDPAARMSSALGAVMVQRFGVTVVGEPKVVESADVEQVASQNPDADLALTVETTNWSYLYFPTDWSHYRVSYGVKAVVADLKTKQVLAEGAVRRIGDEAGAPTEDELLANQAARLKAELQKLANLTYDDLVKGSWKI
jgi:hypothetical protein